MLRNRRNRQERIHFVGHRVPTSNEILCSRPQKEGKIQQNGTRGKIEW
jgi:hypothetical protein